MLKFTISLIACALALATAPAVAQGLKIGFINTSRLETESVQAKRAMEELRKEFEPREKQILQFQQEIKVDQDRFHAGKGTMPAAELQALGNSIATRMRDSDNMVYSMQADFEQRMNERRAQMIQESIKVVREIAERDQYDLILPDVKYARPEIDITDEVLKELARRAGN